MSHIPRKLAYSGKHSVRSKLGGAYVTSPHNEPMDAHLADQHLHETEEAFNQLGVWIDFAPSWDTTLGVSSENGTWTIARYTRIGDTVHFRAHYTIGTNFSTGGTGQERWEFNVPGLIPQDQGPAIAWTRFRDVGTDNYYAPGIITGTTTTYYNVYAFGATSATNANINSFSSTVPFTLTQGDEFYFEGTFEAKPTS